jgi:hypothetical protein
MPATYEEKELSSGIDTGEEEATPTKAKPSAKKSPFDALRKTADAATKTGCKLLEAGLKLRASRFEEIAASEGQYNGEKTKALRGRHNVPFDQVIARGFVDTLLSKVDENLSITFERSPGREQDKKAAEKISAACDFERGPDQGAWDLKDIGAKKLATFSGRGIYKKFSSRVGNKFVDHFEVVDHWDFVTSKRGGGFLDKHRFKAQMNIFLSKQEIKDGIKDGIYDEKQAYKIFAATTDKMRKTNEEAFQYKMSRMQSMGLDYETNDYEDSQLFRFVEAVMYFRGRWYTITFNYETGLWLRFDRLENVYSVAKHKKGRGPWVSWATNFDPFEFWSIAPMDSVRPVAVAMKKVLNFALDSIERRTWAPRAYDPNVFLPKDLLWKDDGLAKANIRPGANSNIANHVYTFETPDTTNITVNLADYLNAFLGEKTGITPSAQGKSDEKLASIYVGNMQQVSDRLGLTNKMYEQAHVDIGVNFQWGLFDHMPEKYAIKIIGNTGVEWNETLHRDQVGHEFTIRIRGGNSEARMNADLLLRKEKALIMISRDPELRQRTNAGWRLKETLALGGYEAEDIRIALDTNSDIDDDQKAEAAQAIEDILEGKKPPKNRGASTGYIRKIMEFAYDTELDDKIFDELLAFAALHVPIAQDNAARKIASVIAVSRARELVGAAAGGGQGGGAPAGEGVRMTEGLTPDMSAGGEAPMGSQGPSM